MKSSKKALSLILAVIMTVTCFSVAGYAAEAEEYIPSIVIPGIFQSETKYYENGKVAVKSDGSAYEAPFFMDSTIEIVGSALTDALVPISELLINQEDKDEQAAYAVGNLLGEVLMEKSRCDENGKFVHDIRATKYNASFAELSPYNQEYIIDQIPLQNYIDVAGGENLYFFSYASLGNMKDTAQELYDFIQFVKEDAGSDKVNIVPISQGGSVANALMQIYKDNNRSLAEDINRIVFVVPALDGSTLIGEIYQYGLLDDSYELYNTMLPSLMGEGDMISYLVNIILRIMPNADVNNILDVAVKVLINDYTRYSTLLWGLCPAGNYPACREMYLMDEGLEVIREQTDWFYDAQVNSDANILKAIEDGVEVFDIVDYNVPLYQIVDSYDDVNADGIIQLDSTSMGAFSLGVDKKLPASYVYDYSRCTDPQNHNHCDPNGIVDAYAGLLPETTFYFYNQDHEKTGSNDVIMKLVTALMTDPEFVDVNSYPDKFPQFNVGRNSKGLMKDIAAMKEYDRSGLTPEQCDELDSAIAVAEEALDNTNVDLNEFEAAKAHFYDVRDKILNGEKEPEVDTDNDAYLDFGDLLYTLIEVLSDILYLLFGGGGFSEM